ncbi:MAG TPA: hypothetical protein VF282_04440, partial [Bacillota bacterium]
AYQHGRDEASLEWAVQLMVAQWERVDWSYVEEQARQQRIDRVVVSKARELARQVLESDDRST